MPTPAAPVREAKTAVSPPPSSDDPPWAPAPPVAPPPAAPAARTAMPADIGIIDAETWLHFASTCGLKGVGKQLVENVSFSGYAHGTLTLALDSGFDYLRSERTLGELADAIAER